MNLPMDLVLFLSRYGYAVLFIGVAMGNAGLIVITGYFFGKEWEEIARHYQWYSGVFLFIVVGMAAGSIFMRFLRRRRHRVATSLPAPEG